jgi:tripartite-type tricarboxylate transporter receptor subunit TctC
MMKVSEATMVFALSIGTLLLAGAGQPAYAQDAYPNRPVRLVVPYPPGGSTDNLARVIAPRWAEFLGQSIVIENRGGAGGNIGVDAVAKAAPDGYTVGLFDTAFVVNPTLYAKLPFDTLKDFSAVMFVATGPAVLVVHPSVPVRTVKDLVALAKARPGSLAYASAGSGTAIHLAGEMLKTAAGLDILHVPYKGAGPAIIDVLSGQVPMMFAQPGTVIGHTSTGKLRTIAMTGDRRWPGMSAVPTFAESGLAGMDSSSSWHVMVPAAAPRTAITSLHASLGKALALPEVSTRLGELAYLLVAADPDRSAVLMRSEIERWGKAVKASGARIE